MTLRASSEDNEAYSHSREIGVMTTLSELKPGEIGRISGFYPGNKVYRQKLLAMGLTPNTEFTVIRRAPLGDPVEIRVRNAYLSLRQGEMDIVKIERVSP